MISILYSLIICGYITDDLLILELDSDSEFYKSYINFKMMSEHEKMTSVPK